MNIAHSIPAGVSSVSFYPLSPEEIRRISVKQIVNPVLLDDLNRPNLGGLYDPALGPNGDRDMYAAFETDKRSSSHSIPITDARLVACSPSSVLDTMATLNFPRQFFILCSWHTSTTSFALHVYSAIILRSPGSRSVCRAASTASLMPLLACQIHRQITTARAWAPASCPGD